MPTSILDILVGDRDEKRAYRQLMKRVNALPETYRAAFKKIQAYLYSTGAAGCDISALTDLAELLEGGAAEKRPVSALIGEDAAAFCDEWSRAASVGTITSREKLNRDILEYFRGEEKAGDGAHEQDAGR